VSPETASGAGAKEIKSITDPPLNAPTGFRTGAAAAVSCKRRLEVWNDLVGVKMGRASERDEVVEKRGRSLEAMLAGCNECARQSSITGEIDSDCDCSVRV
jgi:hypothetical protein